MSLLSVWCQKPSGGAGFFQSSTVKDWWLEQASLEGYSGPHFWNCLKSKAHSFIVILQGQQWQPTQTKSQSCISLNTDDMHFRDAYCKILLAFNSMKWY